MSGSSTGYCEYRTARYGKNDSFSRPSISWTTPVVNSKASPTTGLPNQGGMADEREETQ